MHGKMVDSGELNHLQASYMSHGCYCWDTFCAHYKGIIISLLYYFVNFKENSTGDTGTHKGGWEYPHNLGKELGLLTRDLAVGISKK